MNIDHISIEQNENGGYEFSYTSDEKHPVDVSAVRVAICRFIDDAIDALLRLDNNLDIVEHTPVNTWYAVGLTAGPKND